MAAYRWIYDSRHLQADCQEPGSAPEPFARQSSMGYLYFFVANTGEESKHLSRNPYVLVFISKAMQTTLLQQNLSVLNTLSFTRPIN